MKQKYSFTVTKCFFLFALLLLVANSFVASQANPVFAAGDSDETEPVFEETIEFRLLSTSDLHGQVTSFNYETGETDPKVGLSKLYTLIRKERSAVGKSNTFLVDAGDSLYSYSTNYIYDNYPEDIQPIFEAMDMMGYNCITPGNHDFDYPWDYLYNQLDGSGMLSRTLVSNAVYTESGEFPFKTSAIYTRKMKTSSGRTVSVKIGVVGATYANFSSRRFRYSGFMDGLDIYSTVKAESEQLKADGADIVIALIHGGVGLLSGANTTVQAGAKLAKLPTVDAVVCAHSHETFPSTDGTFSNITNVDEEKGTVYGTPVVQAGSHAGALGVITFSLGVDTNDNISIIDASSQVKKVTASTKENADLVDLFSDYQKQMTAAIDSTEYEIAKGITYTNADCFIQDSALYQLMNNAKLHYASNYIARYAPEYSSYPMVAVTVNRLDNKEQTIELSGSFSEKDVSALLAEASSERSSGYIHIYKLSGANLLEWLEFNASIYGTAGKTVLPELLSDFAAKNPDVSSLMREENLKQWNEFYAFDGISYDIDLSVEPRYNAKGKVANYTHRIKNLTWQGKPVTPDMTFIITMDSVEKRYIFMPTDSDTIFTKWLYETSHNVLMDYIRELATFGTIATKADNNWHFIVPDGYRFIAAIPKVNHDYITAQDWHTKKVKNGSVYYYYLGEMKNKEQEPSVVAAPDITIPTSRSIPVKIYTDTAPGASIKEILVVRGNVRSVTNERWEDEGVKVEDNIFYTSKNGKYSVRVTDSRGRTAVTWFVVDNYASKALEIPIISTITNRIEFVKGTAIPGSTIHVALPDGTIETGSTENDGTFSITVPLPRSYDLYTIWATLGKRTSHPVETTVKKTGANIPAADPLEAGSMLVSGTTDPYVTLSLRIGSTIYVGYGEADYYKNSSLYKSSHVLVETFITIEDDGTFLIELPVETVSGETWLLYATYRNGNASRALYLNVP